MLAEAQGLASHGLSRVAQYAGHLRHGRVNGAAVPTVIKSKGTAALVDAQEGLAFAACDLAITEAIPRAREFGISIVAVTNSHHAGVLLDHLRAVAEAGRPPTRKPAWTARCCPSALQRARKARCSRSSSSCS